MDYLVRARFFAAGRFAASRRSHTASAAITSAETTADRFGRVACVAACNRSACRSSAARTSGGRVNVTVGERREDIETGT